MTVSRRLILGGLAAGAVAGGTRRVHAQAAPLKFGVLTDLSGPYKDTTGPLSVACARLAVADFVAAGGGIATEVLAADHQNKPDIGVGIARQWFDRDGVDVILDVPTSSVALAVAELTRERNKVFIGTGAGSSDLTGRACAATTIHWAYDSWMLAHGLGTPLVKAGGDTWYFITPDYTFGHVLQAETTRAIEQAGGRVFGSAAYPFPGTVDFSAYLLAARASGAR